MIALDHKLISLDWKQRVANVIIILILSMAFHLMSYTLVYSTLLKTKKNSSSGGVDSFRVVDTLWLDGYLVEMNLPVHAKHKDPITNTKTHLLYELYFISSDSLVAPYSCSIRNLISKSKYYVIDNFTVRRVRPIWWHRFQVSYCMATERYAIDNEIRDSIVHTFEENYNDIIRKVSIYHVERYFIRCRSPKEIFNGFISLDPSYISHDSSIEFILPYVKSK